MRRPAHGEGVSSANPARMSSDLLRVERVPDKVGLFLSGLSSWSSLSDNEPPQFGASSISKEILQCQLYCMRRKERSPTLR